MSLHHDSDLFKIEIANGEVSCFLTCQLMKFRKLDVPRSYEIRDYEDLTEEWLLEQLNKK